MPKKTNICLSCKASFVKETPNQLYCNSCASQFTHIAEKSLRKDFKGGRLKKSDELV